MNKEELLEDIAQHTCPDCGGHGEVQETSSDGQTWSETKILKCINCKNGYVEN